MKCINKSSCNFHHVCISKSRFSITFSITSSLTEIPIASFSFRRTSYFHKFINESVVACFQREIHRAEIKWNWREKRGGGRRRKYEQANYRNSSSIESRFSSFLPFPTRISINLTTRTIKTERHGEGNYVRRAL